MFLCSHHQQWEELFLILINLPVCTLSPVCRSDIVTDLPFSRVTLAVEGKQPPPPPPDGGGGAVVVVVGGGGGGAGVVTNNKHYFNTKIVLAINIFTVTM